MTLPGSTETVRDPGLGISGAVSLMPVIYGESSLGTDNSFDLFSSVDALRTGRGEGAAVETAAYILSKVGGPIGFLKAASSVAASNGTPTDTALGGTITPSGAAVVDAQIRVEIITGGDNGVATFRYSLDGYTGDTPSERTYSETIVIPAGGTYAIPTLGITLTFDDTTPFTAGGTSVVDVEQAAWNSTDLTAAMNALAIETTPWRFLVAVTSRGNGDDAAHATLTAALQSHLDSMANSSRYRRAMIASTQDLTDIPSAVASAFAATMASRCLVAHGEVKRTTIKTFQGWGQPRLHSLDCFAVRAAGSLLSTDLKRRKGNGLRDGGPLPSVLKIFHDERTAASTLAANKISTLQTRLGPPGFWISQGLLKSGAGSDFTVWPRGTVMDIACEIVHEAQEDLIGSSVRTETRVINGQSFPGTIDERDAIAIEDEIQDRLSRDLLQPTNAEGRQGHASAIRYQISRTHNILADDTLISEVGVVPLGYITFVSTTLGYVLELAEAA